MTPGYGLKHWWRAAREPGESLKRFAHRYGVRYRGAATDTNQDLTTATKWLLRKLAHKYRRAL